MRNFDERNAEVFRRSENRIRERKRKRNRILALCVPLCLCIAILSVIYLPDLLITGDKINSTEDMNMAGGSDGASGFVYTSLEITSNATSGTSKSDTNKENIENIYNIIQAVFTVAGDKETVTNTDEFPQTQKPETQKGEGATKGDNNSASDQTQNKGLSYTITFSSDDGVKIIYTICDGILTNEATNESVPVTDELIKELYSKVNSVIDGKE